MLGLYTCIEKSTRTKIEWKQQDRARLHKTRSEVKPV